MSVSTDTITYVPLDGTVGLISDGAGTGMLTLDLISDAGARAACFCEMGPIVVVYPEGAFYCGVTPKDVPEIVEEHLYKGRLVKRLLYTM
uniref:(2Fe-2S) ferredoxin domain-containing protein n=1 Tax=Acetomicrobium sp. S15 = DSM 107314 TaxID=2529858 RepID=UPI0018E18DCE